MSLSFTVWISHATSTRWNDVPVDILSSIWYVHIGRKCKSWWAVVWNSIPPSRFSFSIDQKCTILYIYFIIKLLSKSAEKWWGGGSNVHLVIISLQNLWNLVFVSYRVAMWSFPVIVWKVVNITNSALNTTLLFNKNKIINSKINETI